MDGTPNVDQCLESQRFYSYDLDNHLTRHELRQAIQAKRDWIFGGTPDQYFLMHQLHRPRHEECGDDCQGFLVLGSLRCRPAFLRLPRSRVRYDDLREVFGEMPHTEAEILAKEYVCVTGFDSVMVQASIDRYLAVDPLSN
jgi:hypothetical protein